MEFELESIQGHSITEKFRVTSQWGREVGNSFYATTLWSHFTPLLVFCNFLLLLEGNGANPSFPNIALQRKQK